MPSIAWLTGFEHGVMSIVTNGGGLANTISGYPTVQDTIHRDSGNYACSFNPAAYLQKTLTSSGYQVGTIYVYFKDALPTADAFFLYGINTDGNMVIYFDQSQGKLAAGKSGVGGDVTGPTVTYNTFYEIQYKFYTGGTTHTIDWKVDGNDQPGFSVSSRTIANMTAVRVGNVGGGTYAIIIDDVAISVSQNDYPLGSVNISGHSPNADGTHNGGTNTIEDSGVIDIVTPGYTSAYSLINSVPMGDAAIYIKQSATGTGNYAEVGFADTTQSSILAVIGVLAYKSSGTSSNSASTRVRDGSTETVIYTGDMSESTNFYKSAIITPASGWTQNAVNGLIARVGYASDANPNPYWLDLILEVAYSPETNPKPNVTDGLTIGEAVTLKISDMVIAAADSLTIGESKGIDLKLEINRVDGIALGESLILQIAQALSINLSNGLTLAESITMIMSDLRVVQTDSINLGEQLLRALDDLKINKVDGLTLTDIQSMTMDNLKVNPSDNVMVGDTANVVEEGAVVEYYEVNVSDNLTVGDTPIMKVSGNRYWVGGTGSWSDAAHHWSNASGGTADALYLPDQNCDVIIDSLSGFGSGGTITLDTIDNYCKNFTSNAGHAYTLTHNSTYGLYLYGSLTLEAGMTFNPAFVSLYSDKYGNTITTNGVSIPVFNVIGNALAEGGSWILQDDLHITGYFEAEGGDFYANNHNISAPYYIFQSADLTPWSIHMGDGTWEATGDPDYGWHVEDYGTTLSLYCDNSTIKFTDTSANFKEFTGCNKTYHDVWFAGSGSGIIGIFDSCTFADFKVDTPPHTIQFNDNKTITVTTFTVSGTPGNYITINTMSGTNQATLSKANGIVNCDYLNLSNSNATGGATWFAGSHSLNTLNNNGWLFTDYILSIDRTDNLTLGDIAQVQRIDASERTINVSDNVNLADPLTMAIENLKIVRTDGLTLGETPAVAMENIRINPTDNVNLGETTSEVISTSQVNVTDNAIVGEALSINRIDSGDYTINVTDGITLGEQFNANININVSSTDGISLGETLTRDLQIRFNLAQGLAVHETLSILLSIPINQTDNITLGEVIQILATRLISRSDSITLGEQLTLSPLEINSSVQDNITIGENVSVSCPAIPLAIAISDSVYVADAVQVQIYIAAAGGYVVSETEHYHKAMLEDGLVNVCEAENMLYHKVETEIDRMHSCESEDINYQSVEIGDLDND